MKVDILGINVDCINIEEAASQIEAWILKGGKYYIVTPNPEMIIKASSDLELKAILNQANLAIPDSFRLNWAAEVIAEKNLLIKLLKWSLFLFPGILGSKKLPVTTGIDLTEKLIELSLEKGFRIGFLGGQESVAVKLKERLSQKYKNLNLIFSSGKIRVKESGESQFDYETSDLIESKKIKPLSESINKTLDILFVGFGHSKQEKWIHKNMPKLNAKVLLGIGGALDYLSGNVSRAPYFVRKISLEWLYRLIVQPWRIWRFGALLIFIFQVLFYSKKGDLSSVKT